MEKDIRKEQFDRFSADLSDDVRKAIWDLIQCPHFDQELCPKDGVLKIEIDSGTACIRYLTLYNVSGVPVGADLLDFESLVKRRDEYRLVVDAWDDEADQNITFTIRFSHAQVDVQPCRVESSWPDCHPWETLVSTANQLMQKYSISETLFNSKERDLLPLLEELSRLSQYSDPEEGGVSPDYPQLRKILEEYDARELLPILEKLEKNDSFPKKGRYLGMLFARLDTVRYEPLFRKLWEQIQESQKDYPARALVLLGECELTNLRNRVEALMKCYGYSGTYPDFYKNASLKGIRLAESYGMDYFVMGEKNAISHIHVNEVMAGQLCLELICGTKLLKKNQERGDYLSCLFNTKGRTFAKTIFCEENQLSILLPIADKLAQLQRLNRNERTLRNTQKEPALLLFLFWLILGGGAFAVLFTLVTFLIELITLFIAGEVQALLVFPWLRLFLFCWLGFGGLMGIAMTMINKFRQ